MSIDHTDVVPHSFCSEESGGGGCVGAVRDASTIATQAKPQSHSFCCGMKGGCCNAIREAEQRCCCCCCWSSVQQRCKSSNSGSLFLSL